MRLHIVILMAIITGNVCAVYPQQIHVGNTLNFSSIGSGSLNSAEGGSVVIPPGLRPECPKGRILISRDFNRPPATGAVVYRDLDKPSSPEQNAVFDQPVIPDPTGNDHDLILLPNGNVLYVTAASSSQNFNPKPWWFDATFRDQFGPGARSSILTWRSTDGGKTFQYLSRYDPAKVEGGIPAFPQFRRNEKGGAILTPHWDMGGTDGPLVKNIPGSDALYMANMVVGYNPKNNGGATVPDETKPVNKTVLLTSVAGGPWTSLGMMDGGYWRLGMVPFTSKTQTASILFAPSFGNFVFTGAKGEGGKFVFGKAQFVNGVSGWTNWDKNGKKLSDRIWSNIWANNVVSRCPGKGNLALVVFPNTVNGTNGCSVYVYDIDKNQFSEMDPILPEGNSATDAIMHPTIIDPKTGPVMIYWYDLNSKTLTAKIKGRIIENDIDWSPDFTVSVSNSKGYSFNLLAKPFTGKPSWIGDDHFWYGDYHVASGYTEKPTSLFGKDSATVHFFPYWTQPDLTFRYTEVTYRYKASSGITIPEIKVQVWPHPLKPWTKPIREVELDKVEVKQRLEVETIDQHPHLMQTISAGREGVKSNK